VDYVTFGKNIRKHRLLLGLRQADLAEECFCSNTHIGQIENARGAPSLETAVNIANVLGVTIDQLISTGYTSADLVYLREISEKIEKYPRPKRIIVCEALLNYIDTLEKLGL